MPIAPRDRVRTSNPVKMTGVGKLDKLQVRSNPWEIGRFFAHKGKKYQMTWYEQVREFAAENGYSGITIKG